MYHTPHWYASLRDVGLLWQALGGVVLFWRGLQKREHWRAWCAVFWLAGAVVLFSSRKLGLLGLDHGTNVYLVYALSVALVWAACRVSFSTAWMIGSAGFLAQQICGNLELAFRILPGAAKIMDYSNRIVLLDIVFYLSVYLALWRIFQHNSYQENRDISSLQKNMFSLMATLFSLGFYTVNQYVHGWSSFTEGQLMTNSLYAAIGGVFLLVMQYSLIKQQKLNAEVHSMQAVLYAQGSQWQSSKELTELVNEKYHDLKKIVRGFQGSIDAKYLNELSDAIDAYDDHVKTGNQVADVVLTESRELCRKYGIQFTCFVNGTELNFMEDMDLYFLLKNALDNAIEAVQRLPKEKDRFISLTARRDGEFVCVHTENPCGDVTFVDDLPQTQQDADYHGYGVKSMLSVATKYGGMLSCFAKNGIFYLDVVLVPDQPA